MYHAAIQNRSAARFWDSEQQKFDRERGSLQSCSLNQDRKKISGLRQGIFFVLKFQILSHQLTHGRRIPLLMERQFINSRESCSTSFFVTNCAQFFNFLAVSRMIFFVTNCAQFFNFLAVSRMIFLEEPISQFEFFTQADFIFLSLICPSTCSM